MLKQVKETVMLTVEVPDELAYSYENLARAAGRDKVDYILEALSAHLDDIEDARTVSDRLGRPGRRVSLTEVERNLGLDH